MRGTVGWLSTTISKRARKSGSTAHMLLARWATRAILRTGYWLAGTELGVGRGNG